MSRLDIDPEARRILDACANGAANRSGLPEPARSEARSELESHLYDAARARAGEAGSDRIVIEHARSAVGGLGTAQEIDAAFFAPHRARLEHAPFGPRIVAYLIDLLLGLVAANMIAGLLVAPFWFGPFWWQDPTDLAIAAGTSEAIRYLTIVGGLAAFEATIGQTPGKMVMKLRTTTTQGGPVPADKAVLRNLTKGFPPLAILDWLIGYLADKQERLRVSDRLVGTAVVREVQ